MEKAAALRDTTPCNAEEEEEEEKERFMEQEEGGKGGKEGHLWCNHSTYPVLTLPDTTHPSPG